MDTTTQTKSQTGSRSFTRALALAFNEWLLMVMLFANSIFSYVITKFADYCQLQSPCLICSRLDHIIGSTSTEHLKKSHWDMFCSKHKSEISSLVYCHAHGKLLDVRGMCEACLFSFAATNESNSEPYRLLVGKLGEDSSLGSKSEQRTSPRYCTCCNQLWMPQTGSTDEVLTLSKIGLAGDVRTGKQTTASKKSVRFNDLPHVGYTELKIHSDTEPEDVFSQPEDVAVKEEDHMVQNVDLETPPAITLPYGLVADKLINLDPTLQPLVDHNDREEVHFPLDDVPETSENVLKEEEIISLNNILVTSRTMEHSAHVMKEKEGLIQVQDTSATPDSKESSASALVEVSELSPVNGVSETSEEVLKEEEITSLDNLLLTSRGLEESAAVMKEEVEDLIHLQDISLTSDIKEDLEKDLGEETELLCLKYVTTSTSVAAETPEDDVLMMETVSQEKEELVHLQDTSLTPDCKETPADALMEKTEIVCLNDVTTSTLSDAAETSENVLMGETFLKEKENLLHLQDTSLTPDCKETPADALMEKTELVCLSDVTTSNSSETPEHVLKETELRPLHDTSTEQVTESITIDEEALVETSKEKGINQPDMNSLESEYVVVSPSKSTNSLPEDSTENCVSDNKETKETSITVSAVSEMASPESESSSFNSMSVAAETNLDSCDWTQGGGELLDLADAYNNIIVHNESNKNSNIEQWMKKDTSRVSQDLKALLTQISASRISPRISIDHQETKNLDYDMQLLIQKRMLERNESTLSLEGVSVSEIEGESETERLKRQVDHDRKFLTGLYKELEEERSASAVATNQAMAMITRLQEEKATFQMEALQNLRMMEEQAEYDMEAMQKLNELLLEREKVIQDLEAEIDYLRNQTPLKKKLDVADNVMSNCLSGFDEERLYITSYLEKIENMVQADEAHVDNLATQESVTELRERVEKVKGDLYFLEHVVNSLGYGSEGIQFVKEIASHLQILSMKRHNHTES